MALVFIVAPGKTLDGAFQGLPAGTQLPIGTETTEVAGRFTIGIAEARLFAEHRLGSIVRSDGLVHAASCANL